MAPRSAARRGYAGNVMKPVLAYHVIFGAYGFWLPNDPRGSWSDFVGAWELFQAGGKATTTDTRRSVASAKHDLSARLEAKRKLSRAVVKFDGLQARAIGHGFAESVRKSGLVIHACSILPQHVHMVVARFHTDIEQVVIQLKGSATRQLVTENLHPFLQHAVNSRPPKCFARGEWSVFLDDRKDILRAIRYVENNPVKDGKPKQSWSSISPYT